MLKTIQMLERIFKLKENGTNVRTELLAGITTFVTMAYILAVNPFILGSTGMQSGALFTATALAAVIGTICMALIANIPVAQAPGMGLNAFFAYTVVGTMGYPWQFALTAVFIEGIVFLILTATNIRELIVNNIPKTLKSAIPAGIGLFITFIGLQNSGIIVGHSSTLVTLGNFSNPSVWIALFGILLVGILTVYNIKGSILIAVCASTILGIFAGVTHLPEGNIVSSPPSIEPIFAKFVWKDIFTKDMLIIVFTFLFVNLFDTIGTLWAVASKAGLITKDGSFPKVRKALFSDAIATTFGAVLGVSTVTSYVESASGVSSGGRTGLTAISTAVMFILALFFAPLFLMVPAAATTPALVIVGLFMMSSILEINFKDFTESLPAFMTIVMMPFAYSIAEGIVFGVISFVIIKIAAKQHKDISLTMLIIALIFVAKLASEALF